MRTDREGIKILSGFYYSKLRFSELDSVGLVDHIPPMVRLNGFSVGAREKGIFQEFKDTLTDKTVHVYVDNLTLPKLRLVYHDSQLLYINLSDSLDNDQMYRLLEQKLVRRNP